MDSLIPQVVSAAKLPILNPNEFDLWKMRIEQYFLMTDYSLWEVILNGDSPVPTRLVEGVAQPVAPTTVEQKLARKNELKAHGLDQIHDRLQKLVSQLKIHGVSLSQEDVNLKFLRSLPSEWKTHTLIWRNKIDLEDKILNDLFNNLKIYESEVKHSSSLGTDSQNLAFVSSTPVDSTNDSVSDSKEEDMPQVIKDVPSFAQSPELVKSPRNSGMLSLPPMPFTRHPSSKPSISPPRVFAAKPSATHPNIASHAVSKSKSPLKRPFTRHLSSKPSISPPRVTAAKPSIVSAA
nr:hypothetical protein [Tanacetum cinerariifolium]